MIKIIMNRFLTILLCYLMCLDKNVTKRIIDSKSARKETENITKSTRKLNYETKINTLSNNEISYEDSNLVHYSKSSMQSSTNKIQDFLKPSNTLKPSLYYLKEKEKIERLKEIKHLDDIDVQCKSDVLNSFGIQTNIYEPKIATSLEKKYCRRNDLTCCNYNHLEIAMKKYQKGANLLKEKFELIEELLILFRGHSYKNFLKEIEYDTQCQYIFDDGKITKKNLLDETFMEEKIDSIMSVLIDLNMYFKKQLWFYSDFICTICSPLNHQYFHLNTHNSKIEINVGTCNEIMEFKEFEIRLVDIFDGFIAKIANFIVCRNDNKVKSFGAIDISPLIIQKKRLDWCYRNTFDINNPLCREFCQKSLEKYEFPTKIFSAIVSTTKIIYEYFTGNSIEDYYKTVKNKEYSEENLDGDIEFFNIANEKYKIYNLSEIKWELFNDRGATIFSDHMSQKIFNGSIILILNQIVFIILAIF